MRLHRIARRTSLAAACLLAVMAGATHVSAAAELAGSVWNTEDKSARIAFEPCGETLCGSIVWLAEPNDANGKPLRDGNNPDPARRRKPIIGLATFTSVVANKGYWVATSYDPRSGDVHEDVKLTPLDDTKLEVKGCGLGGLICKTFIWTRYAAQ
jgi:uncharacterized protein (DUF2147 family)